MNKIFVPSGMEWEAFSVHDKVNVHRKDEHDMFIHDFTGTVIDKNATFIIVEDQDGDCFTVDPDQLTFNTDEVMHA